jgi:hypothetical protein
MKKVADMTVAECRVELGDMVEWLQDLAEAASEIMGERARFGDSGPGTEKTLRSYYAALSRYKELDKKVCASVPPAVWVSSEAVPF